MSRTFVMGDIHGAYRALRQCLDRAGFDKANDTLIFLGDVSDGWPETRSCIDELLTVKNLICLQGNHDDWTLQWMKTGAAENIWLNQGGRATVQSYLNGVPDHHIHFLDQALPYYLLGETLFVHAGIDPLTPLETQTTDTFLWDRNMARIALDLHARNLDGKLTNYDEVYLGHTPIPYPQPIKSCEVWLMDTGAGWSGVLSMMDIQTKEVFTSDPVPMLYPGVEGRKKSS
jgi:serine/threonine protein phosphatase 1